MRGAHLSAVASQIDPFVPAQIDSASFAFFVPPTASGTVGPVISGAYGAAGSFSETPIATNLISVQLGTVTSFTSLVPGFARVREDAAVANSNVLGALVTRNKLPIRLILGNNAITSIASATSRVKDPLHLTVQNITTGNILDADVYSDSGIAGDGGGVGFNFLGQLELKIGDTLDDGFAEFDSETLVPYATDLTGQARLENGILNATGIFYPDTSRPITDFWNLTISSTTPGYILDAVFLDSDVLSSIEIDPGLALSIGPVDLIDLSISDSLELEISIAPEPSGIAVLLPGIVIFLGMMWRCRRERLAF